LESAAAIDRLHQLQYEKSRGAPGELIHFTYYFFRSDNKSRQKTAEDIVRILLKILCNNARSLPAKVKRLYQNDQTTPSKYADFVNVLISSTVELSAFILFDALDECSDEQLEQITSLLESLVKNGARVLLTSQPQLTYRVNEIGQSFESCEILANKDDLETYVSEQLQKARPEFLEEEYEEIRAKFIGKSKGM
jgi:hypothetical protein